MEKQKAINLIESKADHLERPGVTARFLFGSTARDESKPGSDIDIFMDYDSQRHFNLFDLMEIKHVLEDKTGNPVDVTTRDGLHPRLRAKIEQSAIRVF